jgi:deoxyribodipyrimidine photo-lyase
MADNPAVIAAAAHAAPVIPVFVWAPHEEGVWSPGGASRWWLHQSLLALFASLERLGSRLIIRMGDSLTVLRELVGETRAGTVFWNRRYDPAGVERDRQIESALRADGLDVVTFNGSLLREPDEVINQQRLPFQVFTAYWRACSKTPEPPPPIEAPRRLPPPARWPASLDIDALELLPRVEWTRGLRAAWTPGERGAQRRLREFLNSPFAAYPNGRDRPGVEGTSRLSPHLHFGEVSPRQIWHAVRERQHTAGNRTAVNAAEVYLRELGWREFAHQLLCHLPHTTAKPLKRSFESFPWVRDRNGLRAWQRGRTGYPIVDAGMRELWTTGWMHNRARMIVGSFLVKHLLIDWREGAAWFWDTLVDADLANNTLGWQWVAGCGADAAPYFRIFNPVLQGRKFDPSGDYVRRWVPELAGLDDRWLHAPWEAPAAALREARVDLGRNYPRPIIDLAFARRRALDAFATIRENTNAG